MRKYKLYFITVWLVGSITAYSQIVPSMNSSPVSPGGASSTLNSFGSGITISNVTFTGDNNQLGTFSTSNGNFPISNGVCLTTGNSSFVNSANSSGTGNQSPVPSSGTPNLIYDSFLTSLQPGNQHATCYLDFDFTIDGQSLSLNYVFASEEYNAYAGSNFHDQMGILITGPGIPFGTANIAKVAGSPLSVNTVNGCTNPSFYQNNCFFNPSSGSGGPQCAGSCGATSIDDRTITYNGFTKKMTATFTFPVCNPFLVYHMHIAVANIGDNQLDSGVFLEIGFLKSDLSIGNLVANPSPVCNGSLFNLAVQNVPTSTLNYNWSTGQTGTNLSAINTTASLGTNSYNVTVSSGACSVVRSVNVIVHDNNNIPPYTNGVNNSGDNTIYVQAGQSTCANIPSFDNPNENVTISGTNLPSGSNFNGNVQFQETGTFCWNPNTSQVGTYNFDVITTDQNKCYALSSSSPFVVKSICKSCNIDVYYENRLPSSNPVPAFTKAGRSIWAGYSVDPNQTDGNVDLGNIQTEFKAGKSMHLLPGFIPGTNFWGHLDPSTCLTDCQDCCNHFTGIHTEPLPNILTPNGDGVNDIWMVDDYKNPICAYSAKDFHLYIYNRDDNLVYEQQGGDGTSCCPFNSRAYAGQANVVSSINWDGYANQSHQYPWWDIIHYTVTSGTKQPDAVYFYVLEINGCGDTESYIGNIQIIGSGVHRMISTPVDSSNVNTDSIAFHNHPIIAGDRGDGKNEIITQTEQNALKLYPNPAKENVLCYLETNNISENKMVDITIETILGTTVKTISIYPNMASSIDVKNLPSGTYFVKATYNFSTFKSTLVVLQ